MVSSMELFNIAAGRSLPLERRHQTAQCPPAGHRGIANSISIGRLTKAFAAGEDRSPERPPNYLIGALVPHFGFALAVGVRAPVGLLGGRRSAEHGRGRILCRAGGNRA
jgi:hypothetical protein